MIYLKSILGEDPVLVILGGSTGKSMVSNTSLIVGLGNDYNCTIDPLNIPTFGALGGFSGSQMFYCGGWNKYEPYDKCFYYIDKWSAYGSMINPRYYAGYVTTPYGLFVAGGFNGGNCYMNKTDDLPFDGPDWTPLPDLPIYTYGSCLVQLDHDHTLLIGGIDDPDCKPESQTESDRVFMFDWIANQWSELPKMKQKRSFAMCGQLPNGKILVTGGEPLSNTTEIFDPKSQKWSFAADLPMNWRHGKIVNFENTLLLVNGWLSNVTQESDFVASDIILAYSYTIDRWIEFPKKLPSPRANAVVFLADASDFGDNCKVIENASINLKLSHFSLLIIFIHFL